MPHEFVVHSFESLILIIECIDGRWKRTTSEAGGVLQNVISDTLVNAKAVKLCLHSATIASILNNKEGSIEDQK